MTSDETYLECAFCNKSYTKNQASALLSEFELSGIKHISFTCKECNKGFAVAKDDKKDPLEQIKNSNLNLNKLESGPPVEDYDDTPEYQEYYDDIPAEIYYEPEPQPQTQLAETKASDDIQKSPGRKEFILTEYGNAERLVSKFGQNIRYCFPWKNWLIWNDKFWEKDATGEIMRMAKETVRLISKEADNVSDEKIKNALKAHGKKSETKFKLNAMIELAQTEPGLQIKPEDFDKNSWFLNVQNGTIDLKGGMFLPHTREHLITKITPIEYNPNATCQRWDNFLNRIMNGNQNLIQFIKRAVGYSLTGETGEQCFFFLYGTGANGKSTFLETIRAMLTNYAQQTDLSTFLKDRSSIPNDVARLQGTRFVSGVETDAGKHLAEVFIKRLTGEDTITARFLYQEFFEFNPMFKIFLAANHKPTISGTEHAIWRRIMMIPFTVIIPENEMDKGLKDKLKLELPGILNWAVQGCLEWQKSGLMPPKEVSLATQEYRAEMDILGDFIEDCCIIMPNATVSKGELYGSYEIWCGHNHEQLIKKKTFGTKLMKRGIASKKSGSTRYWSGIGLRG